MNYALWEKQNSVMNKRYHKLFLSNWFRIKGRANRKEYIYRFLLMPSFILLTSLIIEYDDKYPSLITEWGVIGLCIFSIIATIQVFFVTHRRLHDLNASGWWQLITFIPFGQLLMIAFIFFKGTEGPNKYGSPPEY